MAIKGQWVYQYGINHERATGKKEDFSRENLDRSNGNYSSFGRCSRKNLMQTLTNWVLTQQLAHDQIGFQNSKSLHHHTFATLTLPSVQQHDDRTIKRECLNKLLIYLNRHCKAKNYIWKAEVQQNDNIHFHILLDTFIPHKYLRSQWNKFLAPLGYIDKFESLHGHRDPNSTDIHALKKVKNVQAYIGKYVSKLPTGRTIDGHTWGRSDGLKQLQPITFHEDYEIRAWFKSQTDKICHSTFSNQFVGITKFQALPDLTSLPYHHYQRLLTILKHNLAYINKH